MASSPLLSHLPVEVTSRILSSFCDGRSISTFALIVARGDRGGLGESHFQLVRDALVHRFVELARELKDCTPEIKDVLDVVREDVRTCTPDVVGGTARKFSEWCAIIDYFEGTKRDSEWVVWSGPVGTQFGTLNARVVTPLWTADSLQYWYDELELAQFSLVPPAQNPPVDVDSIPYGRLEGLEASDTKLLLRLQYTLSTDFGSGRYALVPSHMEYDPTLSFTLPLYIPIDSAKQPNLACYWEGDDGGYDWEDSIDRLGENVIRIMKRCYKRCAPTTTPTDMNESQHTQKIC